jgi:hypothetical protein
MSKTTRAARATTTSTSTATPVVTASAWATLTVCFIVGSGVARRSFAVILLVHFSIFLVVCLVVLLASSVLVMLVTVPLREASAMRHAHTATEELVTPSPGAEKILRTLRAVLVFALVLGFGLVVAALSKVRVSRALLLEASDEIPEGS